jgi:hypothetical protein
MPHKPGAGQDTEVTALPGRADDSPGTGCAACQVPFTSDMTKPTLLPPGSCEKPAATQFSPALRAAAVVAGAHDTAVTSAEWTAEVKAGTGRAVPQVPLTWLMTNPAVPPAVGLYW